MTWTSSLGKALIRAPRALLLSAAAAALLIPAGLCAQAQAPPRPAAHATAPATAPADRPAAPPGRRPAARATWMADNGNGTYSNPLFYEEFSDPDVIRVGEDYYLTGTTMHTMPGLPVLHSRDLVNWELASYAFQRLDLAPSFRLQGGEIYGQGIWAPALRFARDTFFIFSNINGFGTQVFRSASPRGPWTHTRMKTTLYDLGVLFDDDGRAWAAHGAREGLVVEELNRELTDVVPGTRRLVAPRGRVGEGFHFYKIDGTYYILSAIPGGHTPMVALRSRTLDGPWALDTLVAGENLGVPTGNALRTRRAADSTLAFTMVKQDPNTGGGLTLHQGGIVSTPSGEWWSIIMQDHNSLGRVSALVPVTWENGWPYLGLPGNLRRAPESWVKPSTGHVHPPRALFTRGDEFEGALNPIWQWNHVPDDTRWSLRERPGVLRLHSLPARDFWWARNTLTQRAVGPASAATVQLEGAGMRPGDVAGLALLNQPYAWIGLVRDSAGLRLRAYDQRTGRSVEAPVPGARVWLRADCDFDRELATLQYSTDGRRFLPLGDTVTLVYQLKTFQGIRYSLFHFNTGAAGGGYADFDHYSVAEPRPRGLTRPIPYGKRIRLATLGDGSVPVVSGDVVAAVPAGAPAASGAAATFRVVARGPGRLALQAADGRWLSVSATGAVTLVRGQPAAPETFQWEDMLTGDVMLMSLANHRYLRAQAGAPLAGDHPGPRADHRDGSGFVWSEVH